MKKRKNVLIVGLTFSAIIATFSCQKGDNLILKQEDLSNTWKVHSDLENSTDLEDEKMNDNLFMLANAFVLFSDDAELMEIVYEEAADNNGYINYSDLIASDSKFKSLLNAKLNFLFSPVPLGTSDDPYQTIIDSMIYKTVQYYPAIYFPNYKTANTNYLPYVGIGAEIDDYDNILTYRMEEHYVSESTMNESEALVETAPILIFNNATDHVEYVNTESPAFSEIGTEPPAPAANEIWKWDEVTINAGYRYEAQGKSEVRCHLTFSKADGSYLSGGGSFQNGVEESLIKKVTANDIANSAIQTGVNSDVFPAAGTVSTANLTIYKYAYITTFEYDWYASAKIVASCGALYSVSGFRHRPRMKYSNEWYHNSICEITVHDTWLNYVNATFSFGNAKSLTKIKRTQ